jgi:hypothetical protein
MKKKLFGQDLQAVVEAEKAFIGVLGTAEDVPECYVDLGGVIAALDKARAEGDVGTIRDLSRRRWGAVQAVRAHGPSGVYAVDEALAAMEVAAEEAGEAKRRR